MKTSILLAAFLSFSAHAQENSFLERVKETYLDTDKNYYLECLYNSNSKFQIINPVSETKKNANSLVRDFEIETENRIIPMKFSLLREGKSFRYEIKLDNKHISTGNLKYREFAPNPVSDKTVANEVDFSTLNCHVNLASAEPYYLTDGNYHFNVHPHLRYDYMRKLKSVTENYLKDYSHKSIILLETTNGRGNSVNLNDFFDGVDYRLKQTEQDVVLTDVAEDIPLIVSPAGNSEYIFDVEKELNILFTGGNHNYCIWNATRHVILGLLRSKSTAVINFKYDSSAIVAQRRGVEGLGLEFPRGDHSRSNLLKDLLANESIIDRYHRNWLWYFQNTLGTRYVGQYKSYTINYKAPNWNRTVRMEGKGSRDLIVNITIF